MGIQGWLYRESEVEESTCKVPIGARGVHECVVVRYMVKTGLGVRPSLGLGML